MDILGGVCNELHTRFAFDWSNFCSCLALVLLIRMDIKYYVLGHFLKLWFPGRRLQIAFKVNTSKASNFQKASCTFINRILWFWNCFING